MLCITGQLLEGVVCNGTGLEMPLKELSSLENSGSRYSSTVLISVKYLLPKDGPLTSEKKYLMVGIILLGVKTPARRIWDGQEFLMNHS